MITIIILTLLAFGIVWLGWKLLCGGVKLLGGLLAGAGGVFWLIVILILLI